VLGITRKKLNIGITKLNQEIYPKHAIQRINYKLGFEGSGLLGTILR